MHWLTLDKKNNKIIDVQMKVMKLIYKRFFLKQFFES